MKVSKTGQVRLAGILSDGSKFGFGGRLSHYDSLPVYSPLYGNKGALVGMVKFESAEQSDANGFLNWNKTPKPKDKSFAGGFSSRVSFTASRYLAPARGFRVLPELADTNGNAALKFREGGLPSEVSKKLYVSEMNKISVPPAVVDGFKGSVAPATGIFRGTYVFAGEKKSTPFQGALLQKQNRGGGFFVKNGQSGIVSLEPLLPVGNE